MINIEKGPGFLFQQPIPNIAQLACSKNSFVKVFIFLIHICFIKL